MKPGVSQVEVAKRDGIKVTTLNGFMRDKTKILAATSSKQLAKRVVKGHEPELEERLHSWFLKKRSQGMLLDRPLLRNQGIAMAKEMNIDTSQLFSYGWAPHN